MQHDDVLRSRFIRLTLVHMPLARELLAQGSAAISARDLLELHLFLRDLQEQSRLKLRMDIDVILRGIESGWLLQWLGIRIE